MTYKYNILTEEEKRIIDKYWEFIEDIKQTEYTKHNYRKKIIKLIRGKYSLEEFYLYEKIAEKLYLKEIKDRESLKPDNKIEEYDDKEPALRRVKNNNYYRSEINKYIIEEDNQYKITTEPQLYFSTRMNEIMTNREVYEEKKRPKTNDKEKTNFNFIYVFPNINYLGIVNKSKEDRIKKIKKYYYEDDSEKNWFNLL